MHDLDQRFENQDRMINYLINQINNMETSMQNSNKRSQGLQDHDRESIMKIKNELRFGTDAQV